MSQKLVLPFMVDDCLVVLLGVLTEKMALEIPIHGFPSIKVIGHTPGNVGLIGEAELDAPRVCEGRSESKMWKREGSRNRNTDGPGSSRSAFEST